ncbi:hypothetical protein [Sphingobacterium cellulitidis]|uniref:hypothetical protein n=1 Tax=Sphingobacterium cellulitidis TaxID=1768011 RepID=UPI003C7CEC4B
MNLVIKNTNEIADENSPIIYKDPLVTKGTLLCVDFSNGVTIKGGSLSKGLIDLADDAAIEIGVQTNPMVMNPTDMNITVDKGLSPFNIGFIGNSGFHRGINFSDITRYLYEKQPKALLTFWIKANMTSQDLSSSVMVVSEDASAQGNVFIQNPSNINPYVSARFANKRSLANFNIGSNYTQISIEFTGTTTPNKVYVNGEYLQDGEDSVGGFIEPTGNEVIGVGHRGAGGSNGSLTLYRIIIEDLTASERSAESVIIQDYNFVNALEEYEGIIKRPFANII